MELCPIFLKHWLPLFSCAAPAESNLCDPVCSFCWFWACNGDQFMLSTVFRLESSSSPSTGECDARLAGSNRSISATLSCIVLISCVAISNARKKFVYEIGRRMSEPIQFFGLVEDMYTVHVLLMVQSCYYLCWMFLQKLDFWNFFNHCTRISKMTSNIQHLSLLYCVLSCGDKLFFYFPHPINGATSFHVSLVRHLQNRYCYISSARLQ